MFLRTGSVEAWETVSKWPKNLPLRSGRSRSYDRAHDDDARKFGWGHLLLGKLADSIEDMALEAQLSSKLLDNRFISGQIGQLVGAS